MAPEVDISRSACLYCGQTDYAWGYLFGRGTAGQIKFRPDGPFFTLISTDEPVRVRKCEGCGNIQCFSEQQE